MSNTNPQRKISRLQLKKLKEAAEYNDKVRVDYKRATITITKVERELKDARERNEVQNKYWHNIGVERNTLKEKYDNLYEDYATNLVERNSFLLETERLKDDIKELETELYFCNRNKRIGEIVDENYKKKLLQ